MTSLPDVTGGESGDEGEVVVQDTEVSIEEMLSLACRQGKQEIVELLLESGASVNHRNSTGNTPLLEACSQGHVIVAKLLLDRGAEIDAPTDTTYDSALTWACTLGNEDVVKLLLEYGADVEHHTKDGCTALMFASLTGHKSVAGLLLDKKARVNVESESNKDSPLTFACWKGHEGVVKLLLQHGSNVEHRTKEGFTPLMFAALGGHVDVAKCLLVAGAEVNTPSGSNNDIPMTSACWKGHHEVVKLLLLYNSDIEHRTKDGCTPLMLAAREGHYKVAHWLLMSGAKVNVPSGSENNIPLTLACWKGHYDVVKLLLQHSSHLEHHNKAGCTPLMLAAREGHFDVTFLLLEYNAEIDTPSGSNDDTPLTLSCWKGHTKIVELLLSRGANVDHQTKTGCTPLMEATREGHHEVSKLLLENGADVEMPDNYGQSPLFMACWKGHAPVAQLLLEHRANIGCRTKTGITPLFQACRENHVGVVSLLLHNGCSVNGNFPNSRENPLTLAAEKGHVDLAQLLLEEGANVENRTKKGYTPFFLACKEGHLEICRLLHRWKAEVETQDLRGTTPLVAAFRNGHVEVVDWLLGIVKHLPSDTECQKCLMGPCPQNLDLLPQRTRCLEKIIKAKKAKELAAARNAQRLCAEIAAEEETKRKAAARKRAKRKKKRAAKKCNEDDDKGSDEDDLVFDNKAVETPAKSRPVKALGGAKTPNTNGTPASLEKKTVPTPHEGTARKKADANTIVTDVQQLSINESRKKKDSKDAPKSQASHELSDSSSSSTATPPGATETSSGRGGRSQRHSISRNTPPESVSSVSQTTCSISTAGSSTTTYSRASTTCGAVRGSKSNPPTITTAAVLPKIATAIATTQLPTGGGGGASSSDGGGGGDSAVGPLIAEGVAAPMTVSPSCYKRTPKRHEITSPSSNTCVDNSRDASSTKQQPPVTMATGSYTLSDWQEIPRTSNSMRSCFITVPNTLIGRVIGKGGRRINTITDMSGAQITVSKPTGKNSDRTVTIRGLSKSVTKAQNMISSALQSNDIDSYIEQMKPTPRPHSAPTSQPEVSGDPLSLKLSPPAPTPPSAAAPVQPQPAPGSAAAALTDLESDSQKPASFGPIGSSIQQRRLTRSFEDISTAPPPAPPPAPQVTQPAGTSGTGAATSSALASSFTPYSLYPTWPPTAFETERSRESHAIADGKMSYAEAVADTKLHPTEHPLLEETAWSSPDSDTGSSSGANDDDKAQGIKSYLTGTGASVTGGLQAMTDYMFSQDLFTRSTFLSQNFKPQLKLLGSPTAPPVVAKAPGFDLSAATSQPSSGFDLSGKGPAFSNFDIGPTPAPTTSGAAAAGNTTFDMNSSHSSTSTSSGAAEDSATTPFSIKQPVNNDTISTGMVSLGNASQGSTMTTPLMTSTSGSGVGTTRRPYNTGIMGHIGNGLHPSSLSNNHHPLTPTNTSTNASVTGTIPNLGAPITYYNTNETFQSCSQARLQPQAACYNPLLPSTTWAPMYNGGSAWPQDVDQVSYYQWPLQATLHKLGLSEFIPRLETLKLTVPQLVRLTWTDLHLRLGFTEAEAQRITSALSQTSSLLHPTPSSSASLHGFYQPEILQYP